MSNLRIWLGLVLDWMINLCSYYVLTMVYQGQPSWDGFNYTWFGCIWILENLLIWSTSKKWSSSKPDRTWFVLATKLPLLKKLVNQRRPGKHHGWSGVVCRFCGRMYFFQVHSQIVFWTFVCLSYYLQNAHH